MKVEWEADDIKPGRRVGNPTRNERWIIGYLATVHTEERYVLISLSDGLTKPPVTKGRMAIQLTEDCEIPAELL